jgi:hypothetical protein
MRALLGVCERNGIAFPVSSRDERGQRECVVNEAAGGRDPSYEAVAERFNIRNNVIGG